MKNVPILFLLLGLIGTSLTAGAETTPAEPEEGFVPLTEAELKLAVPAWDRYCAKCHGEDGNGPATRMGERLGLEIDYTEAGGLDGFTDDELDAITAEGIDGTKMPGFSKKLSPQEINALTRYMRSMSEP